MIRPGYHFDNHKRLVALLHILMDEAATMSGLEYDEDEDVVDDFNQYVRDWAIRRLEGRRDGVDGV